MLKSDDNCYVNKKDWGFSYFYLIEGLPIDEMDSEKWKSLLSIKAVIISYIKSYLLQLMICWSKKKTHTHTQIILVPWKPLQLRQQVSLILVLYYTVALSS